MLRSFGCKAKRRADQGRSRRRVPQTGSHLLASSLAGANSSCRAILFSCLTRVETMNQALQLLLERTSSPRLQQPAPSAEQLELLFRAALCAPDHGQIRPWRFLVVEGQGLVELGELYASALLQNNPAASTEQLRRAQAMPLRAPMIIVLIACLQEHPKVPEFEQIIAAGCAGHGILLAAQAMGLGAFWRSGEFCNNAVVANGLGLQENEKLIGFMYLGTPSQPAKPASRPAPAAFVGHWPPPGLEPTRPQA